MRWSGIAALLFVGLTGGVSDKKPHIILFVIDDLGWNDVGFHGSNEIPTPNIDALAYNGVIFDKHYTLQSCTPSRAALLTGQYPIRLGYQGFPMRVVENRTVPHGAKTLPSELKKLGYKTHLVGKWHLGYGYKKSTPQGYGFDTHYGFWNGYIGYFNHTVSGGGMKGIDLFDNLKPVKSEGIYATDLFTKRSVEIIDAHPVDQPLFLSINHLAAHTGITNKDGNTSLEVRNMDETNLRFWYIKDPTRRMLAEVVERVDLSVGKVVTTLKERGLLNDSILVFMSDNGGPTEGMHSTRSSNFPLRGIKLTLFEGGIRVPAAIYYPKMKNMGRVYKNLFHITDWVPTLYTAAGGDPVVFSGIDGIDQWRAIANGQHKAPRGEFLVNLDELRGMYAYVVQNGKYKIIKTTRQPFDKYTGSRGKLVPYYMRRVLNSATNKALSTAPYSRQEKVFRRLRNATHINDCRIAESALPDCTEWCLFDLFEDPCEAKDLSAVFPEILAAIQLKIDHYMTQSVQQQDAPMDPRGNPDRCEGYWFNWLEDDGGCHPNLTLAHLF